LVHNRNAFQEFDKRSLVIANTYKPYLCLTSSYSLFNRNKHNSKTILLILLNY
jgi:hypothetical protein